MGVAKKKKREKERKKSMDKLLELGEFSKVAGYRVYILKKIRVFLYTRGELLESIIKQYKTVLIYQIFERAHRKMCLT